MRRLFVHDCYSCVFLGLYRDGEKIQDLYFCPDSVTVIARSSSDGSHYESGMAFVGTNPALTEAFRLAYAKGLIRVESNATAMDAESGR